MITAAADFFGTLIGKLALGGGIIVFFTGLLLAHDHRVRVAERERTLARVDEGAKALNAKGLKARDAVLIDGAAYRLRREYCDGC